MSWFAMAQQNPTFKADQYYFAEGRWFVVGKKFLFKINEGTSNEELIIFSSNSLELANKVKYKLCFKTQKVCAEICQAEAQRKIKVIDPWEDATLIQMNTDGTYPALSVDSCK